MKDLLDRPGRLFQDPGHAHSCRTSCQRCLRHYGNRLVHGSLDWRLALDMVEALFGVRESFDLSSPWWRDYLETQFARKLAHLSPLRCARRETSSGTVFLDPKGIALLPVHPLLHTAHRALERTRLKLAQELSVDAVQMISVFDFERFPVKTLQSVLGGR